MVGGLRGPDVVEKFVAGGCQHLRHNVLIHIAQVGRELVGKELLVDNVLGDVLVPEGESDEIPRFIIRKMYGIPNFYRRIMYGIPKNQNHLGICQDHATSGGTIQGNLRGVRRPDGALMGVWNSYRGLAPTAMFWRPDGAWKEHHSQSLSPATMLRVR